MRDRSGVRAPPHCSICGCAGTGGGERVFQNPQNGIAVDLQGAVYIIDSAGNAGPNSAGVSVAVR